LIPEPKVKVSLVAKVSPSEDPAKVARAVLNVVGDSPGELKQSNSEVRYVSEETGSLAHLRYQLRDRRVRAVARKLLLEARQGSLTELLINRQAAAAGVVALCGSQDESPLGPICLRIQSDQLEEVIGWLTAYEGG
jgi:predicted RNA binding protein with dsRBD fold (UPF0201 family)